MGIRYIKIRFINYKYISSLLFTAFTVVLNTFSQIRNDFERINTNNGLSDNEAITVLQDKEGFLWIGTMSGLNRFDGNSVVNVLTLNTKVKTYNNRINKIVEDDYNNLWLETFDGSYLVYNKQRHTVKEFPLNFGDYPPELNKSLVFNEDGIAILVYKNLGVFILDMKDEQKLIEKYPFTSNILSKNSRIISLFAKDNYNIYINTDSGLILLKINPDTQKGEFKYLTDNKTEMNFQVKHITNSHYLYTASTENGLVACDLTNNHISLTKEVEGISLLNITSIKAYNDLLLLSTKDNGVVIMNTSGQLISHVSQHKNVSLGEINNLYIENNSSIWFRTNTHEGLFRLNSNYTDLMFYPVSFKNSRIVSDIVIKFFEIDSNNNIWIGTTNDGIIYFDNKTQELIQIKNIPNNSKSLISNGTLSFLEDKNSNIWIGTKSGISKTNIYPKNFHNIYPKKKSNYQFDNRSDAIFADSKGNKWFSSSSGEIYVYDKRFNLKHVFTNNKKNGFPNAVVYSFLEDSKGRLWIGTKGEGLFMINLKKYHNNLSNAYISQFYNNKDKKHDLNCPDIYDILEDNKGRVWFATYGNGIHLLYEENGEYEFIDFNRKLKKHLPYTITFGRCLLLDNNNNIWFGGLNGLYRFSINEENLKPENIKFYYRRSNKISSLSHNDVGCIYQDSKNNIWVGTNGGGLNLYEPKTQSYKNYSTTDGLPNNMINTIIEDIDNNLWISTKNGLTKFNYNTNNFSNFTIFDGLPSNEFTESKAFIEDKFLYFATTNGITYFNPKQVKTYTNPSSKILLTNLFLSNEVVDVDKEGPLPIDINLIDEIKLKHDQNNISISYSTDEFLFHKSQNIEYKLDKVNDNWLKSTSNQITFTNIPPGSYQLKVQIKDQPESIKSLKISISPPIWKTNFAYFTYIIFTSIAFYIAFTIFKKFITLQNSLYLEKSITDYKLKFFTDISHELRTPLTLIINPIREIINNKILKNTRGDKLINIAYHNANNILKLVNEILDFRNLQTNNIQLKVTKNDLTSFFIKVTDDFNYVAQQNDITFSINIKNTKTYYWFDQEKLEKVIINLLTNAFKFTPHNGYISVNLDAGSLYFTITVSDSGKGFNYEQNNEIFNKFHKEHDSSKSFFAQGYGIGLSIVQELVTLHKGEIKINSKPEQGATFTIKIPGEKKAYKPQEISEQFILKSGGLSSQIHNTKTILIPNHSDTKFDHNILLVEDNRDLLTLLSHKLMGYYNIKIARNGVEAFDILKNFTPDIIITDLLMPEMNGSQLTKKLKSAFETSHIPIIMLTAKAASTDRIEGYDIGADAYLTKPFEYKVLISRINNLLIQRKILREKFGKDLNFESRSIARNKEDQDFVESIHNFVIKKLSDSDFTLQDLYDYLGISKTVCYGKIKGITDMSPNQFVRTIKFKEAAKLFKTTNLNVSQVAYEIGYSDINYFRNQFKAQFNKTPSQFIKEF